MNSAWPGRFSFAQCPQEAQVREVSRGFTMAHIHLQASETRQRNRRSGNARPVRLRLPPRPPGTEPVLEREAAT
jgi:hypothetical protein